MSVQRIDFELLDRQLGSIPALNSNLIAYVGACSSGTQNALASAGDAASLAYFGQGPLAECGAHNIAIGGGPFLGVPCTPTAGSASAPAVDGANPLITISGTPNDAYELLVRIVAGGTLGAATFQYSLDAGRTWSNPIFAAASYPIPSTGLTLGFPAGTYVAAYQYGAFTVVGPSVTLANVNAAVSAAIDAQPSFGFIYVAGTTAGVDDAAKSTAFATLVSSVNATLEAAFVANKRAVRAILEAPDVADAALLAAMASVVAPRVSWVRCPAQVISDLLPRIAKTEGARVAAARLLRMPLGKDPSQPRTEGQWAGALPSQIVAILRDERKTPGIDDARGVTFTTYVGKPGFFLTNWPLCSAPGSDYKYLQHGQIIDAICNGIRTALFDFLSVDLEIKDNGTGQLTEGQATVIDEAITAAAKLIAGSAVTNLTFRVSRTLDVLTTESLEGNLSVLRKAYPKKIKVRVGYTRSIVKEGT